MGEGAELRRRGQLSCAATAIIMAFLTTDGSVVAVLRRFGFSHSQTSSHALDEGRADGIPYFRMDMVVCGSGVLRWTLSSCEVGLGGHETQPHHRLGGNLKLGLSH